LERSKRNGQLLVDEERPWIYSATYRIIDAVVKMRRSIPRVACISNVAEYVAGIDDVSGLEAPVAIEMCVVMNLSSGTENVDDLSTQLIGSNSDDDAFCRAEDWRAARGEDVYSLV
jgi:hypothetical protein